MESFRGNYLDVVMTLHITSVQALESTGLPESCLFCIESVWFGMSRLTSSSEKSNKNLANFYWHWSRTCTVFRM
jgi:hypothetical protein